MNAKIIARIVAMFFAPISIIGVILYFLYTFVPALVEIMFPLLFIMMFGIPIGMAITGMWLIRKHNITNIFVIIGVIALSAIATIYGFDMMHIAGWLFWLPYMLGVIEGPAGLSSFVQVATFIWVMTYVILIVRQLIITFTQKKNSAE